MKNTALNVLPQFPQGMTSKVLRIFFPKPVQDSFTLPYPEYPPRMCLKDVLHR